MFHRGRGQTICTPFPNLTRNRSIINFLFHLATLSSRNIHESDPQHGYRVNVEGFVNAVEHARKEGCETIVYVTSSIYGSRTEPSPESTAVETRTA